MLNTLKRCFRRYLTIAYPSATIIDNVATRSQDVAAMLDPATPGDERHALIAKYEPEWFVTESENARRLVAQLQGAKIVGRANGYAVIRLTSP